MADTITIERECKQCRQVTTLSVTAEGFAAWDLGKGAYVQNAFPELPPDLRELLVSGICGPCFDALFADLDELDAPPGIPGWLARRIDRFNTEQAAHDECDTGPTPGAATTDTTEGASGVTDVSAAGETSGGRSVAGPTPAECASRALLGLTAEGEPATRGHLRAPTLDWPRCATEIPGLQSPIFYTAPNICNRPATLMMGFGADYLASMRNHRCGDPGCPIEDIGRDEAALSELHTKHVPLCAMHLPAMRQAEQQWIKDVGAAEGTGHVFELMVIGVETVSLLGGGHPDGAQVIDLRPLTGGSTS